MNEPVKVRGHWVVFVEGKKKKFKTEAEALDALGLRDVQLEIEWIVEDEIVEEKSIKSAVFGLFDSKGDNSNS